MYCIEVIGFGVACSSHTPAIELRDITGLPALSWENAPVHIQFSLQGFNLRMMLNRPGDKKPVVYINASEPLEDDIHKLYAGDRILIPGLEVMMVVFSTNWQKTLRKRKSRQT